MSLRKEGHLKDLLGKVDVACWAWAVKTNTKKGQRARVDWKSAIEELCEEWQKFQLKTSEAEAVLSQEEKP